MHWLNRNQPKWERGLGLRDMGAFNKFLLAKKGWRIIRNQNSLLPRTLMVCYFPHGSFQRDQMGYRLSYTWQCILEGLKVLELGLVWVVGDSQKIEIWKEPWLSENLNPFVQTPRGVHPVDWIVRELMEDDNLRWNDQKVCAMFSPVEAALILATPISPYRRDVLSWRLTKMGVYSVKPCYVEWMKMTGLAYY